VLSDENLEKIIYCIPENQNALPRLLEKFKEFSIGIKSTFTDPKSIVHKTIIMQIRGEIVKVKSKLTMILILWRGKFNWPAYYAVSCSS
jgi:hypothetical protein